MKPAVLSISAHDPLAMSGIAMDQRALSVLNVHCASCITATTSQNQRDFFAINAVDANAFKSQLDALAKQDVFSVIKIGMVPNLDIAKTLAAHPIMQNKTVVLDPVIATSSEEANNVNVIHTERLSALLYLLPLVNVLTPNLNEAKLLLKGSGIPYTPEMSHADLALALLDCGVEHVLLKGGHGNTPARDIYASKTQYFHLEHITYDHTFNRGTGCAMASLIAGACALQHTVADAVVMAKMVMQAGWQNPYQLDKQTGGFNFEQLSPFETLNVREESQETRNSIQVPYELPNVFVKEAETELSFLPCKHDLGLYPIVDRAQWLNRLLPLGVKIIQLRIKDLNGDDLKNEIQQAVHIAKQFNCQLFINDYWQLAIEYGAYGVHLGQEDIDDADLEHIAKSGLRLGLSSHCFYEVARAKTIKPSYIAFGPVYATQTKDMPWIPQGANGLTIWRKLLKDFPMVAIGGIHDERFSQVKATGVDSIAMVSAITAQDDPEGACLGYMEEWG
ncbi:bifunctional hydroxymethylpyrimidine kinase/phosphomethylpyrimidine kinase [Oceaniserpentilla sp. 4NH20-0058]|uniref:thiamine phosphate synthase n=1 Tax=Oceaniserpentilla sp. 4NH20-0058 TaxID=3127660 RepID=UPI003106DA7F